MTALHDHELLAACRAMLEKGSKSFAKAARLFDRATRDSVTLFYAWCRHCDDVIDGQDHGHNTVPPTPDEQRQHLQDLHQQTNLALTGGAPGHVAFAALQRVVQRHDIGQIYLADMLAGFAADVEQRPVATIDDLMQYCYGVAGAVGIIMAQIMGVKDAAVLHRACDLGLAFQLTNIARDVVEDAAHDRCYLPMVWRQELGFPQQPAGLLTTAHRADLYRLATRLIAMAEPYYASATFGLSALPFRSAWAVASALLIYRAIGQTLLRRGPDAWQTRLHTSAWQKMYFVAQGLFVVLRVKLMPPATTARQALWTSASLST